MPTRMATGVPSDPLGPCWSGRWDLRRRVHRGGVWSLGQLEALAMQAPSLAIAHLTRCPRGRVRGVGLRASLRLSGAMLMSGRRTVAVSLRAARLGEVRRSRSYCCGTVEYCSIHRCALHAADAQVDPIADGAFPRRGALAEGPRGRRRWYPLVLCRAVGSSMVEHAALERTARSRWSATKLSPRWDSHGPAVRSTSD